MNNPFALLKLRAARTLTSLALASVILPSGLVSCTPFQMNEMGNNGMGTLLTGAGGAVAGGIIGHQSGRGLEGAVIGTILGAGIGNAVQDSSNRAKDADERRIAEARNE
jgi:outer membrane lipoprotein SlyB